MHENEIAKIVVDCAFKVHSTLGPGLLEHIYEVALQHELKKRGLDAVRQVPQIIVYDDHYCPANAGTIFSNSNVFNELR
jgi:GxxExxY protein